MIYVGHLDPLDVQLVHTCLSADLLELQRPLQEENPLAYFQRCFGSTVRGLFEGLPGAPLHLGLQQQQGHFVFMVEHRNTHAVDITRVTDELAPLGERFVPDVLRHLDAYSRGVRPSYTPTDAVARIMWTLWEDDPSGEALLDRCRDELSHSKKVKMEDLTREEVEAYAEAEYLTPTQLRRFIDPGFWPYQEDHLTLEELAHMASRGASRRARDMVKVLQEMQPLAMEIPECDWSLMDDVELTSMVVYTLTREERDVTTQIYDEHVRSVMESGYREAFMMLGVGAEEGDLQNLKRYLCAAPKIFRLACELQDLLAGV